MYRLKKKKAANKSKPIDCIRQSASYICTNWHSHSENYSINYSTNYLPAKVHDPRQRFLVIL